MKDFLELVTLEAAFQLSPHRDTEFNREEFWLNSPVYVCTRCWHIEFAGDYVGFYCPDCGSPHVVDLG